MAEPSGFLGIEHRPFNYPLREARLARGWTRRRLADEAHLSPQAVGRYESLKGWPPAEIAQRLADALGDAVEALFPPEAELALRGHRARTVVSVLPVECLSLDAPELLRLEAETDTSLGLREAMREALSTLSERDRRVIQAHYGLDGPPRTYEQIARELGVTRGRVRQIEDRGLNKLRRPSRAERLEEFVS